MAMTALHRIPILWCSCVVVLTGFVAQAEEEVPSLVQNVFWEWDAVPKNDPDYIFDNHETVVGEDQQIAKIGVFVRACDWVTIKRVDYAIEYPKELLEFIRVERHWVGIHNKQFGRIDDVDQTQPGVVRFSWILGEQTQRVHINDNAVAQLFFRILKRGEAVIRLHHTENEKWKQWSPGNEMLVGKGDPKSHNWVYLADGKDGPIQWDETMHLILRATPPIIIARDVAGTIAFTWPKMTATRSLRYTLDGTDPTDKSAQYTGPFSFAKAGTIKVMDAADPIRRVFTKEFASSGVCVRVINASDNDKEAAIKAIDGSARTSWQMKAATGEIFVQLAKPLALTGIMYWAPEKEGRAKDYELLASSDGSRWEPVGRSTFGNKAGPQVVMLPKPVQASYIGLKVASTHDAKPCVIPELDVLFENESKPEPSRREIAAPISKPVSQPKAKVIPADVQEQWDAKLLARAAAALKEPGKTVRFQLKASDATATLRKVDSSVLLLDLDGAALTFPLERLSLADRKNLALAVVGAEAPADCALVAFYLLATGDTEKAERLLEKAGAEAAAVRATFQNGQ
ncbi:MAG: discoidin domain-containing protein [Planctomycetota bacterium]|nr:discoidin domain-containing protein [Planctomycetota bacterium]